MFESITFEVILQRMLDRVPSSLDRRQGSIIYNALAPAAAELQNMYIELNWVLSQSFADTAIREYLVRRCRERGITPYPATPAVLEGRANLDVPLGARFTLGALNYRVTERLAFGVFKLECEVAGAVGGQNLGALLPIDYIDGLTSAEAVLVLVPGEDEEATEHLRERYFAGLTSQAFGGNVEDYRQKVNALAGVGGVKVYPTWNGGGTVRLAIISSDYTAPTAALLADVQTAVDPVQNQGAGLGIAPVGHVVTVTGVTAVPITIQSVISYQPGWTWADVRPHAEAAVDAYFAELRRAWADSANLIVRVSQIETRLLNTAGVLDVSSTLIDGLDQNRMLGSDEVPVRGGLSG